MQISVKTLDSQTKVFTVSDEVTTQEAKFYRILDKLRTTFQFCEHFIAFVLHFIYVVIHLNSKFIVKHTLNAFRLDVSKIIFHNDIFAAISYVDFKCTLFLAVYRKGIQRAYFIWCGKC